jgi:endonuclease III
MHMATKLGIDIQTEQGLFRWLLASFFFGKRIQQQVAERTYKVFMQHGLTSPRAICACSWQELVDILGEGHYVRYDESTARYLLDWCQKLADEYDGKLRAMQRAAGSLEDFERRLLELKGVGPKTVEIFMREARPVLFPSS